MKKIFLAVLCVLMSALLCGCAESAPKAPAAEMWMLNVGKGDAIVIAAQGKTFLIDAGKPERWGVIQGFLTEKGITRLDGVFLTHADSDHAGGLMPLAQSEIEVGNWYAPAYSLQDGKKSPAPLAAAVRGQTPVLLQAGDTAEDIFRVLAPARLFEDKEDNNSLVMAFDTAAGRVLLTGDMEFPEEAELLAREKNLRCAVLKVANHGDDDTLSPAFAQATRPSVALISTDPYEKPGTPDFFLLNRLEGICAAVFRTDESEAGIHVLLNADGARAEYFALTGMPPMAEGIRIADIDAQADTVTLQNDGPAALDLGGWYLHSSRGDEMLLFPAGTALPAGAALTVGSLSSAGDFDLIWNDKNVIHNSKADVIALYDSWGRYVDSLTSDKS